MDDRLNRYDLTDEEWEQLAGLLPADPRQGHRWNDHRMVIDGVLFRTRTGCPWRDLPEGYGSWKAVYSRHRRWSLDGIWERSWTACGPAAMRPGVRTGRSARTRPWCAGTSTRPVPAARFPPGWLRGAPPNDKNPPGGGTSREALGRSRGGLSTKIHLAADRRCRPVTRILQDRAVATRHDKRERIYQGTADIASIRIWLRDPVP